MTRRFRRFTCLQTEPFFLSMFLPGHMSDTPKTEGWLNVSHSTGGSVRTMSGLAFSLATTHRPCCLSLNPGSPKVAFSFSIHMEHSNSTRQFKEALPPVWRFPRLETCLPSEHTAGKDLPL